MWTDRRKCVYAKGADTWKTDPDIGKAVAKEEQAGQMDYACYRCLFFISFFLAILIANTGWRSEASWVGFLSESSLLSFQRTASQWMSLFEHTAATAGIEWCILVLFSRTLPGIVVWGSFCCMAGIFTQLFLCISTDSIWYSGNVCVFLYLFSTVAHLSGSCFWNASSDGLVS